MPAPAVCAIRFHLANTFTRCRGPLRQCFPGPHRHRFRRVSRAAQPVAPARPNRSPSPASLGQPSRRPAFVQTPKPIPQSFATNRSSAVNAYKFTNEAGRGTVRQVPHPPTTGVEYLSRSRSSQSQVERLPVRGNRATASPPPRESSNVLVQLAAPKPTSWTIPAFTGRKSAP